MAYVCKKHEKFHVYDSDQDIDIGTLGKCFDVVIPDIDILIASSIALLNEKGYTTESSCAEHYHPFLRCEETYSLQDVPPNSIYCKNIDAGEMEFCYMDHRKIQKSYVEFRNQHKFNTLPVGWKFSKGCYLYYEYDSNLKEYEFYKQQVAALGNLYNWVLLLPVIE